MNDMQTEAFELAATNQHVVRGTLWRPATDVRAIIQIFHGLGEHLARYSRFAALAAAQGIGVVAHDHRGHGPYANELGHLSAASGWQDLVDDGLLVNDLVGDRFPGTPIILLGHSMGSYLAQSFSLLHDYRLTALILSASTWPEKSKLIPGMLLARVESLRIGTTGKSALLNKLGFGDFNKQFEPARTDLDWLSRDETEVDAYINDPLCGGPYSCGLWLALMGGLRGIASDTALRRIRSELPILLTGGSDDPVGGERGISELAIHYARSGHTAVTSNVYAGGRHEMFNETNRDEFSSDVLDWLNDKLPGVAGS